MTSPGTNPLVRVNRRCTRLASAVSVAVLAVALPLAPALAAGQATVTMSGLHTLTPGALPDGTVVPLSASFREQVRYPISAPGRGTIQGEMNGTCGGTTTVNRPTATMAATFTLTGPSTADFSLLTDRGGVSMTNQSARQMTVNVGPGATPLAIDFDDYAVGFNWVPGTVLTRHVRQICRYASVSHPFVATAYDRHTLN
ncbi:hypothetical protein ACTMSW_08745 [Micromonospora sp. BQ11]|uniref:hypothetical protein n=1 Tax=Micromonospora sp. BQ11 TaxID=3452212 RepID=UPI003F8A2FEF